MTANPSTVPSPDKEYYYQYIPSTSFSSCSISNFSLECNFQELASKFPEFQAALRNVRRGQKQQQQQQQQHQQFQNRSDVRQHRSSNTSINIIRPVNDEDDGEDEIDDRMTIAQRSTNTSSCALSTQITHSFNVALTRALLQHHFQLQIPSLPQGHLCPPVPNRANYVCWLRDLLMCSRQDLYRFSLNNSVESSRTTPWFEEGDDGSATTNAIWSRRGLDIGTGVSAIYPLLLTTSLFGDPVRSSDIDSEMGEITDTTQTPTRQWTFLATDIDPVAIESACINIQANSLNDRIQVVAVNPHSSASSRGMNPATLQGPLFVAMSALREGKRHSCNGNENDDMIREGCKGDDSVASQYPKLDFVMTNPPFYESRKDATRPRRGDKRARIDMSTNESVYKPVTIIASCDSGIEKCNTKNVEGNEDNLNDAIAVATKNDDDDIIGGDVGFVTAIMNDSQYFRNHITWYTSLISKRSSLDAILGKLQVLDGVWGNRGQIRTVEFRQRNVENYSSNKDDIKEEKVRTSPRVRWGIAWTYERAIGRCSACRIKGGLQTFEVWIHPPNDAIDKAKSSRDEVASRFITFYKNLRDISLKCSFERREHFAHEVRNNDLLQKREIHGVGQENFSSWCVTAIEERFCASFPTHCPVQTHENDNKNLPLEGHFIIDAFLENSCDRNSNGAVCVKIVLDIFCHTKSGIAIIEKIRNVLPGEICRSNRRWRRLLNRTSTER